jgi:hypothetical protein
MNESFDFIKDAQDFFKDKIHALSNAIAHETDSAKISKLKSQLRYAENDWKKYTELYEKRNDSDFEQPARNIADIQYCKKHFWLL